MIAVLISHRHKGRQPIMPRTRNQTLKPPTNLIVADVEPIDDVEVSIGPQFLELFSEHLYSSPNKAFEELVSNSWDAGASTVYVGVPDDLAQASAAVWVLDDGVSMDLDGLHALWRVAVSPKLAGPQIQGRPPIGKFGIGKLATYILAHELTYICKAADGRIRAVTMDYRRIRKQADDPTALHNVNSVKLGVWEISEVQLKKTLDNVVGGDRIWSLIRAKVPRPPKMEEWVEEFGVTDGSTPDGKRADTWTLALLTALKPAGQKMQAGRIRWLLRTALPLGSSMVLVFNEEHLSSSKIDIAVEREWRLGPGLGLSHVILPSDERRTVSEHATPFPHVTIQGIDGILTGNVRLYADSISGGKSDALGASNGFFVNILGRVINPEDPYFGLENLHHSTWAKFKAMIRADGFNTELVIHRGGLLQRPQLTVLRAFLLALFNKARAHDAALQAVMPHVGEVLTKSWGVMPTQPLSQVVSDALLQSAEPPSFVDTQGLGDREAALHQWEGDATKQPGKVIDQVAFDALPPEAALVRYDVARRAVIINRNHPFARMHAGSPEQQRLLRDLSLVDLLTQAYLARIGVDVGLLNDSWQYRDRALRVVTQVDRSTGPQIAHLLLEATAHARGFEIIVSDALEYLGFSVLRLAQSGKPEGVATAPTTPNTPKGPASYKFTFDAKSSIHDKAKTKDVGVAGLVRHRSANKAQFALVVAPGFQDGALVEECKTHKITPMRAEDLAKLLWLTAVTGPFDLNEFRSVFSHHDPEEVHDWVESFCARTKVKERIPLDVFLSALDTLSARIGPNVITTSVIALTIGQMPQVNHHPTEPQVRRLVAGLSVLVPDLVQLNGDKVFVSTSPSKLREAILAQVREIPPKYGFGAEIQDV